jgi:hypothetical protein
MPDLICLNLAVPQVQGSLGMTHVRDPICLDLVVSQIQGT